MISTSRIFWHGTPADLTPLSIRPQISYLEAIWLSADPEVAALYAGPTGTVHGFVISDTARILPTRQVAGGLTYPSIDEWTLVRAWLESRQLVLADFDCLSSFKIEAGFVPALGAHGQPSWKALFDDLCETHREGEDLLEALDLQAIIHDEAVDLALGDRSALLRSGRPESYQSLVNYHSLARRLTARKGHKICTIGVLDPMYLTSVCSIRATEIADESSRLPVASEAALEINFHSLDCSRLAPHPSP